MAVMTVKQGVKSYAERTEPVGIQKDSGLRNISAEEQEKFAGKGLDEILNSLADPNWVDPQKKMRQVGNNSLDKDAFMKLMLTQMKHQDPTNPMQSHEMAAQLAQFTSVEQLQNMNSNIEALKNAQNPASNFQALSLLGKAVSGDSSQLTRSPGDKDHDFKFRLPGDASEATIKVRNSNGEIIRTYSLRDLKAGENKISWNGQDERGIPQSAGEYQFMIEAKNSSGKKLAATTQFDGIISGVNYTAQGPVLMIGNQGVKLSDVKKIVDPSLMKNDQNVQDVTKQDLRKEPQANQNESKGAPPAEAPMGSNLGALGMSREMVSKLEKETGKETAL